MLSKGAARRGRGEALAHARVAVGGSGWRMRAVSQKPGTLRGARPHSRAHACASLGFPACAHSQSRSGACARYLRRTRVAGFPLLQAPASRRPFLAPSPPVPFLSSRNGAGAARGRAPGTRLALGLALSATARLAPPRALAQSLAPKAPLSSGGGGGSCFRFFLSLQSGVASSTQPPLPLPQRWAAAAKGSGGGDWGTAETASAPVSGKGAFGGRAPRAPGSGARQARDLMKLRGCDWRLSLLFSPRPDAATAAAYVAAPGKVGRTPRDSLAGAFGRGLEGEGRLPPRLGLGAAPPLPLGVAHPCIGQGPKPRGEGMGAGWEVSLFSFPHLPAFSTATWSL